MKNPCPVESFWQVTPASALSHRNVPTTSIAPSGRVTSVMPSHDTVGSVVLRHESSPESSAAFATMLSPTHEVPAVRSTCSDAPQSMSQFPGRGASHSLSSAK